MTAVISNNVFAPAQTASFKFNVQPASTVVMTNNIFQSDNITRDMLPSLTSSGNVFLPFAKTPASQEFAQAFVPTAAVAQ